MENNEEMITIPRAEYEAQKQQILKLEQQVSLLMEAMRLNRHKRFGASSEKTEDESAEQLNFLFNEAEVYAEKTAEEPATVVTVQIASLNGHLCHIWRPACDLNGGQLRTH